MIQPRTCSCGYMMEWRPRRRSSFPAIEGVYFCGHCDLGCVGASNGCGSCKRMGMKL